MVEYTKAVGTKFNADGSLRYFPGNTIICKTPGIEPLTTELLWAQNQYKQLPFAHKFSFLPPSSFHMTVFELLCDQVREPANWSTLVPLDAPITASDAILREAVAKVQPPQRISMDIDAPHFGSGIIVRLLPTDAANETILRQYRDELANATGIRFRNHDMYRFHISLNYNVIMLDEAEKAATLELGQRVATRLRESVGTFQLGAPEFTLFDDMGDFQNQLVRRRVS